MRAAMFEEVGRPLKVGTVEDPRPAPDQVVIEVAHCGICGSDLHVTQHGLVPSGTILGHEFAGTIVEIGREVGGDWRVGDRATALPIHACRRCEPCAFEAQRQPADQCKLLIDPSRDIRERAAFT